MTGPSLIESIARAALAKPPEQRSGYLDSACHGNSELRRQVDQLLAVKQSLSHGQTDNIEPADAQQLDDTRVGFEVRGPHEPRLHFLARPTKPGNLGRLAHYEIQNVLGKGGYGVVLQGFDERLHRAVAIKVLSEPFAADADARRRFVREARAAAAVKNDHVVGVHDVREDADPPYLVMELIDGISLQEKLDQGALSLKQILEIGRQIAEGLSAAHKQGLVHRDIKPANILLENGQRVKITDFGLARAVDDVSLTQSGTIAGTPMFMSPEQANGQFVDHRSDLFSLGTVLYLMATGRPPFLADSSLAILKRVCEETPRPLHEINANMPCWLGDLVMKLHAKKPGERYQSAHEVAKLLGQQEEHGSAGGMNTTMVLPPDGPKTSRRRSAVIWIAVVLLAVCVVAVPAIVIVADLFGGRQNNPVPAPPAKPERPKQPTIAEMLASQEHEWGPAENLGKAINMGQRNLCLSLTADECIIVFASDKKLWTSRRVDRNAPFADVEPLPDAVNADDAGDPSISADGLLLAFSAQRNGTRSIWMAARKSVDEPFGDVKMLPEPVNNRTYAHEPIIGPDGLTLLFTSARPPVVGGADIVMFTRKTRDEPFRNRVILPRPVNTEAYDVADWISADGNVLIATKMAQKPFETRYFVRAGQDAPFGEGQPLGGVFANVMPGRSWLSPDGQRIYYHSRDPLEHHGDLDLYMSRRVPKQK